MERTLIGELESKLGQQVKLKGWVLRIRRLSQVNFIILRDRSGTVQVVLEPELLQGEKTITVESVVEIKGMLRAEARAPGGCEVEASSLRVISRADSLPINVNAPSLNIALETVLDHRLLSLRHAQINPIFKIQAGLVQGFMCFLNNRGFTQVFTPKIVAGGTEGGTELFALDYFQKKAYLAQSPQFYKQMMVGAGYERVYEVGHVYRAEKHATVRHLNEYVSLDLELGFIEDEQELMDLQNELLRSMFRDLKKHCSKELEQLEIELPHVPEIPRLPFFEALRILREEYGKTGLKGDLDPEGERLLGEYAKDKLNSAFIFVTDYPWGKRPMYTMPKGEGLTAGFDLLFRGLEITTGGQRIHHYDLLKENIEKKGLDPEMFQTYLENFAWGMPPHGGLAMGLERLTAQIAGLRNIREAALFPRDRHRLTP